MAVFLEIIQLLLYLVYTYIDAVISIFVKKKPKSIAGKLTLVTGAGHGIGRELALQLSALGARLVLWDINKTNNERVAAEIKERGGTATAYVCDVSKIEDIKDVSAKVRREVGDIDILVNNAGILNGGALLELSEKDIRRTMDINVMAHFWTLREFLPAMIEKNSGMVINIASMAGKGGVAYLVDYCASKFAVVGMTEALADEMRREGHTGIKFTYVCPMFVDTGLTKYSIERFGRMLTPHEVAETAIHGALTEEYMVTIPTALKSRLRIGALMPRKFILRLNKFLGMGINPQYEKRE